MYIPVQGFKQYDTRVSDRGKMFLFANIYINIYFPGTLVMNCVLFISVSFLIVVECLINTSRLDTDIQKAEGEMDLSYMAFCKRHSLYQ